MKIEIQNLSRNLEWQSPEFATNHQKTKKNQTRIEQEFEMKFDVDQWIADNVTPCLYDGDDSFLAGPTERTTEAWKRCLDLLDQEQKNGGVLDVDTSCVSTITSHKPGYILDKDIIAGLQTDYPLKRACKPAGGCRMVEMALEAYGHKMTDFMKDVYTNHRKTHNDGVFDAYDDTMRALRSNHLLTGLPDAYGRGRIIGDYRRAALYGIDQLIAGKEADKKANGPMMTEEVMRAREELSEQIRALKLLKELGTIYGFDIGRPAENVKEAIQWTYFAYLGAVKEQDGAAMSLGRLDSFIDVYAKKDLDSGAFTESQIQEMVDDFVIKLRFVRHLRTPAFEQLFSGGPTWVTATVGGLLPDGRPLVTKTSFRILQTLHNMGPAPEPNMTILWSTQLPMGFKRYCSKTSIQTSAVQYENDDVMRPIYGHDYSIACCVSAMKIGKQMQFFGARINLPKLLLYVFNEGKDEITGKQVGPKDVFKPFPKDVPLGYDDVMDRYKKAIEWGAGVYANTMNCIHYMHDKYNYERLQMAFHDTEVHRFMAYGCAGLSVVADALSAIRYAKVTPTYYPEGEKLAGITDGFKIEGEFPTFGNDDDKVDEMAKWATTFLIEELRKHKTYRNSEPTLSVLTITSNVVYGNATGATPDGRPKGAPFAPGANPMHGRDCEGALASLNSVAKIDFDACRDGISYTFSIIPSALGKEDTTQLDNLSAMLDGYFVQHAHHLNVNVLNREMLLDAQVHPDKYPQLTIRVSGYAVKFTHLTKDQQNDVISRTFHSKMVGGTEK